MSASVWEMEGREQEDLGPEGLEEENEASTAGRVRHREDISHGGTKNEQLGVRACLR